MVTDQELNTFIGLVQSGAFNEAANYANALGVPADVTATYVNANAPGLGLPSDFGGVTGADVQSLVTTGGGGGGNTVTTGNNNIILDDNTATNLLNQFGAAMYSGDFTTASNLINQAANIFGPETYANMAQYLGIANQGPGSFSPSALQTLGPTFVQKPPIEPPLPDIVPATTTESNIDPIIAPYLQEALGQARSLFLGGRGPQLFPGQMYVQPSAQTEAALTQMEQLAGLSQPYFMQAQEGLTQGMRGLQETATGGFLQGSPYRDQLIEAATRPITQQFTEQVMPGIQSTFSQAGRLGSGAQAAVTGRATEAFGRAVGDVTSQIAAQDYARERAFQEQAQRDVINAAGQFGGVFSSFLAPAQTLAQVGAQREAIAGQPLQESIRRFEYAQQLPYQQLGGYLSSIYGSPLADRSAPTPQPQGNTALQNVGGLLNIAGGLGQFGQTDLGKSAFSFLGIPGFQIS